MQTTHFPHSHPKDGGLIGVEMMENANHAFPTFPPQGRRLDVRKRIMVDVSDRIDGWW
jgi:hypothetical protein